MKTGLNTNTNTGSSTKYISIFQGTMRVKVPEGTEGSVSRVNKKGTTVHEMVYDSVVGFFKSISFADSPFGRQVQITLEADETRYVLQLGDTDYLAMAMYKMLPNVDSAKLVRIKLSTEKRDDGTERTSLFINQEDEAGKEKPVKYAYTQAEPNGMPEVKEVTVNGKVVKDKTDQINFLMEHAVNPFITKLQGVTGPVEDVDF